MYHLRNKNKENRSDDPVVTNDAGCFNLSSTCNTSTVGEEIIISIGTGTNYNKSKGT